MKATWLWASALGILEPALDSSGSKGDCSLWAAYRESGVGHWCYKAPRVFLIQHWTRASNLLGKEQNLTCQMEANLTQAPRGGFLWLYRVCSLCIWIPLVMEVGRMAGPRLPRSPWVLGPSQTEWVVATALTVFFVASFWAVSEKSRVLRAFPATREKGLKDSVTCASPLLVAGSSLQVLSCQSLCFLIRWLLKMNISKKKSRGTVSQTDCT